MITAFEKWQSTRQPSPLKRDEVHLWRARLIPTPALRETLSPAEWIRAERYHFERDRERFIAARGLLRSILASYLKLDPRELSFSCGPHGKPEM